MIERVPAALTEDYGRGFCGPPSVKPWNETGIGICPSASDPRFCFFVGGSLNFGVGGAGGLRPGSV
jgi:hypothetical protein